MFINRCIIKHVWNKHDKISDHALGVGLALVEDGVDDVAECVELGYDELVGERLGDDHDVVRHAAGDRWKGTAVKGGCRIFHGTFVEQKLV